MVRGLDFVGATAIVRLFNPSSSRMGGSYTSTLPCAFMSCMGTTLPMSVLNLGMKIIPFSLVVWF